MANATKKTIQRKTKVVTLSLPQAMYRIARDLAKKEHRTISELFREGLRCYINKDKNN